MRKRCAVSKSSAYVDVPPVIWQGRALLNSILTYLPTFPEYSHVLRCRLIILFLLNKHPLVLAYNKCWEFDLTTFSESELTEFCFAPTEKLTKVVNRQ